MTPSPSPDRRIPGTFSRVPEAPQLDETQLEVISEAFERSLSPSQRTMVHGLLPMIPGRPPELRSATRGPHDLPNLLRNYLNVPYVVHERLNAIILEYAQHEYTEFLAFAQTMAPSLPNTDVRFEHHRRYIRQHWVEDASEIIRKMEEALVGTLPAYEQPHVDAELLWEGDELTRRYGDEAVEVFPVSRDLLETADRSAMTALADARRIGIDAQTEENVIRSRFRESGGVERLIPVTIPADPAERLSFDAALDKASELLDVVFSDRKHEGVPIYPQVAQELLEHASAEELALERRTLFTLWKLSSTLWKALDPARTVLRDRDGRINGRFHDRAVIAFQLLCQEAGLRSRIVDGTFTAHNRVSRPALWVEVDSGVLPTLPRFSSGCAILVDPLVDHHPKDGGAPALQSLLLPRRATYIPGEEVQAQSGQGRFVVTPYGVYATMLSNELWDHQRRIEAHLQLTERLRSGSYDPRAKDMLEREAETLHHSLLEVPARHLAINTIRRKLPFALPHRNDAAQPTGIQETVREQTSDARSSVPHAIPAPANVPGAEQAAAVLPLPQPTLVTEETDATTRAITPEEVAAVVQRAREDARTQLTGADVLNSMTRPIDPSELPPNPHTPKPPAEFNPDDTRPSGQVTRPMKR